MHSAQSQCTVHLHFFDDFNGKVIYGETVSLRLTFATIPLQNGTEYYLVILDVLYLNFKGHGVGLPPPPPPSEVGRVSCWRRRRAGPICCPIDQPTDPDMVALTEPASGRCLQDGFMTLFVELCFGEGNIRMCLLKALWRACLLKLGLC